MHRNDAVYMYNYGKFIYYLLGFTQQNFKRACYIGKTLNIVFEKIPYLSFHVCIMKILNL